MSTVASFHVFADGERRYRWRLLDTSGAPMAESVTAFRSADACARDAARFRVIVAAAAIGPGRHRSAGRVPLPRIP